MANPYKGEITFEAGGQTYTLRYGQNAWAELEPVLGLGPFQIIEVFQSWQDPKNISFKFFRALVWGGLRKHHKSLTLEQVGDLIDEVGPLVLQPVIVNALQLAFPSGEAETKDAGPTITNGTGSASSVTSSVPGLTQSFSGISPPEN